MTTEQPTGINCLKRNKKLIIGLACCAVILCITTALLVVVLHRSENHWNYHEQDKWPGLCNSGRMQSPIALNELYSDKPSKIRSLNFQNLNDTFKSISVGNNGHTVSIRLDNCNCSKPILSGGGLIEDYILDNLHFHWPSEHTMNGKRYELEGHFVFFPKEYQSLNQALEIPSAVTVVAILFSESSTTGHDNFKIIDEALKEVNVGHSITASGLIFQNFFPKDKGFFKYTGSLTTPNCNENINWIVLKNPSEISGKDLKELIQIYTKEGDILKFNNRKLQDINGRTIYLQQD